jgi:AAA+ ATPase superfamily predicted ATPase
MKLSEFILLNEVDKKCTVMKNAVALAQRTYPNMVIFLFQLEDYYVETYCNVADKTIEEYRILPDTNAISHYLQEIPIDDLLN